MISKMNRQALFALLLIILDVGYFAQALTLPRPFQLGEPGPAFLPILLSLILFISCVCILWQELAGTVSDVDKNEVDHSVRIAPRSIVLIVATALFVWAFEPLGYWIATFLYTITVAWLFEREREISLPFSVLTSGAIAAGVTTAGWLFFMTLFGLSLPLGIIEGITEGIF